MKIFYQLLANALVVSTKNNFVWFALTYWAYLETQSVLSTSIIAGMFLVVAALSSFWFGSLVDHYKKKQVMLGSGIATLALFTLGLLLYMALPPAMFSSVGTVWLWIFVFILLAGVIAGNIFGIAIPALVPVLVPEQKRDRANGMFGTAMGISFSITSFASGLVLAYGGMFWVLVSAIGISLITIAHLLSIRIPEKSVIHIQGQVPQKIDIKGTIRAINNVPGLFALIFFTMFNNFLGGVFMSLMDAYGLTLVSVEVWGTMWGVLSLGFIAGGLYISRFGLGKNPLSTLFRVNIVTWTVCIFFTIQPSIVLLGAGMLIWMCLVPFAEATEQTIIQKVVPPDRLGRVFGFAHSIEQAASPITAFFIGPVAQFVFIPFMTTGKGVELIGSWFGVGPGRGIALVFILAGIIGLFVTLVAMHSRSYKLLAKRYAQ